MPAWRTYLHVLGVLRIVTHVCMYRALGRSAVLVLGTCRATLSTMEATTSLAPDPRSQCDRYTQETYAKMRDDVQRTEAYRRAIEVVAPGRVCLDIGTGALALLALMAAKAGARHVYAVEANERAYDAAVQLVVDQGLAERVTVLRGYSTDVELPQRVDLLLHEIIGEVAGAEGVVMAIADAARRHLAVPEPEEGLTPRVLSVPARVRSLLAPAEFPGADYFASLPFPMLAAPGAQVLKLPSLPRELMLSRAQVFEDLRFESARPLASQDAELNFVIERAGILRGLAVHIELFMAATDAVVADNAVAADDAAVADISSAEQGSHWPNVFLMLPEELAMTPGQRVEVRTAARLAAAQPRYSFEVFVDGQPVGSVLEYPDNL